MSHYQTRQSIGKALAEDYKKLANTNSTNNTNARLNPYQFFKERYGVPPSGKENFMHPYYINRPGRMVGKTFVHEPITLQKTPIAGGYKTRQLENWSHVYREFAEELLRDRINDEHGYLTDGVDKFMHDSVYTKLKSSSNPEAEADSLYESVFSEDGLSEIKNYAELLKKKKKTKNGLIARRKNRFRFLPNGKQKNSLPKNNPLKSGSNRANISTRILWRR